MHPLRGAVAAWRGGRCAVRMAGLVPPTACCLDAQSRQFPPVWQQLEVFQVCELCERSHDASLLELWLLVNIGQPDQQLSVRLVPNGTDDPEILYCHCIHECMACTHAPCAV